MGVGDFIDVLRHLHAEVERGLYPEGVTKKFISSLGEEFVLKGFKMISSSLVDMSYYFAGNQKFQDHCYQDICKEVFSVHKITPDVVARITFFKKCISKTLYSSPLTKFVNDGDDTKFLNFGNPQDLGCDLFLITISLVMAKVLFLFEIHEATTVTVHSSDITMLCLNMRSK